MDALYIYPLSLHDALPISTRRVSATRLTGREERDHHPRGAAAAFAAAAWVKAAAAPKAPRQPSQDRKSTRLNSSHLGISYAVFCLKKKKITITDSQMITFT